MRQADVAKTNRPADGNASVNLYCSSCRSRLEMLATSCKCTGCAREFPAPYGIPCLSEPRRYDFGEISQGEMCDLLQECERTPWREALVGTVQKSSKLSALLEYVARPCRAAWWPLLNLQPRWRVLDLGCGWGAITFGLAPYVASVVACDLDPERLRFLKVRAVQDGVSNVQLLCAGDTSPLPFAEQEFDLVVLSGVLALTSVFKSGSPITLQREFLREVARVLSPEGQLLLAARNRWSLRYLQGKRDDHHKLPFITLLPRAAADLYAKKRTHKPYRTHTYSFWGYKRLLGSAGFPSKKAYIPVPDFRSFDAILDPTKKETVERYFAERGSTRFEAVRLKARALLAPFLATSFLWIADRGEPQPSFLESLAKEVASKLHGEGSQRTECTKFRVTAREVIACELNTAPNYPKLILKIPTGASSNIRTSQDHETLLSLRKLLLLSGDWPEIPEPLLRGEFRNVPYYVQGALPGFSGLRFLRPGIQAAAWKQLGLTFILRLHSATRTPARLDEATWNEAVLPLLEPGLRITEQRAGVNAARIRNDLTQELIGLSLPFVFSHGDYWPGNLLFDQKAQRLTGVIDWDFGRPGSLPLVDLLNMLLSGHAESKKVRASDVIRRMLQEGLNREDGRLVDCYLDGMGLGLSFQQIRAFLLLTWLLRISMQVSSGQSNWWYPQEWIWENVDPVVAL
jgi:ubiquinone/menaquinone biosynthesis C-methylase UbiE